MAAYPGNTTPQNVDDEQLTLKKILLALIGGGPSGPIPVAPSSGGPATVTPTFLAPGASSTTVIPPGSIGPGILILTGTGTINAIAWPTGTPWNDPNKLAASVTLVLASASTAVIYYGT